MHARQRVSEFPDLDASGRLTIDGVLNGSSPDPSAPAWKQAISACKNLQPPGFTGNEEVSAEEQGTRLEFAECMRENGVEDFPDPVNGELLVDTSRIPSSATEGGMTILNAAMQTCGDRATEAAPLRIEATFFPMRYSGVASQAGADGSLRR